MNASLIRQSRVSAPCRQPQRAVAPMTRSGKKSRVALVPISYAKFAGAPATGFMAEMRQHAMKLHTTQQAPKEGQVEAPKNQQAFNPSKESYLKFLTESKLVYETMEDIIAQGKIPEYVALQATGLERSQVLVKDLAWFKETYGLDAPELKEDGPGMTYSKMLREVSEKEPSAFICHWYNHYFAHTAGGRMIGTKVSGMILDKHVLEFYKWDTDLNTNLEGVRIKINTMAENWSEEQRNTCLEQTSATFQAAGNVMRVMMT